MREKANDRSLGGRLRHEMAASREKPSWTCEVCGVPQGKEIPRVGCERCAKLACPACTAWNGYDCIRCS